MTSLVCPVVYLLLLFFVPDSHLIIDLVWVASLALPFGHFLASHVSFPLSVNSYNLYGRL